MDSLPGNAPFVLSAMTPARSVDIHPTLNLAVYQRAPLPIHPRQHLLCDAGAHAVVCRAPSHFSRDESRYSNQVGHGLFARFLHAAHSREGPPPPPPFPSPPPGPSVIFPNAQPLSQIKQVPPEADDTTSQRCWSFGPPKSHNHPTPTPTHHP